MMPSSSLHCQQQQQQQPSHGTHCTAAGAAPSSAAAEDAPCRMHIRDLVATDASSHNFVRIMGTLVAIRAQKLTLDDGTGVLVVHSNDLPIKGAVGQTIDVILRKHCTTTSLSSAITYTAETIIWNVSSDKETLRRLELSFTGCADYTSLHFGYPCPAIHENDVKRMIHHGDDGVTLDDLCLVLDASPEHIEGILQDLQLAGEIYCNRQGCYVPL